MALPKQDFDASTRSLGEMVSMLHDPDVGLVLDAPYQRGAVWTEDQQRALIKSVLMGLPIGNLFINVRDKHRWTEAPRVVDGQQRLRALDAFINGGLWVPTEWVDDRGSDEEFPALGEDYSARTVKYSDLSKRAQLEFRQNTLNVQESYLPTEEQEAEMYLLINFGGVAQTDADRDRAASVAGR